MAQRYLNARKDADRTFLQQGGLLYRYSFSTGKRRREHVHVDLDTKELRWSSAFRALREDPARCAESGAGGVWGVAPAGPGLALFQPGAGRAHGGFRGAQRRRADGVAVRPAESVRQDPARRPRHAPRGVAAAGALQAARVGACAQLDGARVFAAASARVLCAAACRGDQRGRRAGVLRHGSAVRARHR
eukprot:ctg_6038.g665